ncbi:hypothetical protein HZB07_00895 [Candidatus Saganbacteria bacterium]|nr:hypothetical protein [Candidatus Saganbacteria bacterium]
MKLKFVLMAAAVVLCLTGNLRAQQDPPSSTRQIQLFVEPAAGRQPIIDAINGAKQAIRVESYLLTDFKIMQALRDAARRGINVRIILGAPPYEKIKSRTGNPAFALTHAKFLIIDNSQAFIMTLNLTKSAFGRNREFGVITGYPDDVEELKELFEADWDRSTSRIVNRDLVCGPSDSRVKILSFIDGAKKSLEIYNEELQDKEIENHLLAAVGRGVDVRLILPPVKNDRDPNAFGQPRLLAGGVKINWLQKPFVHAKMILADRRRAFVGSQNFSPASLDRNREVGILLDEATAIKTLAETFDADWTKSRPAELPR